MVKNISESNYYFFSYVLIYKIIENQINVSQSSDILIINLSKLESQLQLHKNN